MTERTADDLWRDFPRTAIEFERRFATAEGCRNYDIKARRGGKPACARCRGVRVWTIRDGTTFECAECGHQTSLTSGTVLEKTRKPLKAWLRAVFEIATRRTGIAVTTRLWDGVVDSHTGTVAALFRVSPDAFAYRVLIRNEGLAKGTVQIGRPVICSSAATGSPDKPTHGHPGSDSQ